MREFMHRYDGECHNPQKKQAVKIEEALNAATEFIPVKRTDHQASQNSGGPEYVKSRRECPPCPRLQPIENLFGVKRQKLPVQKIAVPEFVALDRAQFVANLRRIEQPLFFKRFEK